MPRSSPSSSAGASPGSTGPSTGKRETLAARAQRIIGKSLDTDEASKSDQAENAKKGPPKKSPTRRREQVLQAQRTHRQRTQGYIKELEKEVLRLRDREMTLVDHNNNLLQTIETLKQTLFVHNIALPIDIPNIPEFISTLGLEIPHHTAPFAVPSLSGSETPFTDRSSLSEPPVTINLTELASIEPANPCSITAALDYPTPYEDPATELAQAYRAQLDTQSMSGHGTPGATSLLPTTLSTQSAVDFVLELERPCLPHVKYRYMMDTASANAIPDFNYGAGHAFTATASLINTHWDANPTSRPFEVPPDDIDRLFQASLSLDLGPDVTPIQIWANLSRISAKHPISPGLLRVLTDEFFRYVRCNSFGTVVERTTVDRILGFFFPGEEFKPSWSFWRPTA